MIKKVLLMGLCAGLFLACDGVTEGDIERAARAEENADQASGLRLNIGLFWAQSSTQKEVTDDGSLSTAGQFTSNTASIATNESSSKSVSKVMGKTYVESVDKNGFVIETVAQDAASTTGLLARSNFVLFESDNWVRFLSSTGDSDVDAGTATHPIAPRVNVLYTNDQGQIFKGEQAETVANFPALKLTRQFAPDPVGPAEFYAACFIETPGATTGKDVTRRQSCEGSPINMGSGNVVFNAKRSESIWVGRQLLLKSVTESEQIIVNRINCGGLSSNLDQGNPLLLADCTGTISFDRSGGVTKRTNTTTADTTKFGVAANVKAQPQIEDAQ